MLPPPPSYPRALLFDMDGVLLDSEPLYQQVNLALFAEAGAPLTVTEYQRFIGMSPLRMWTDVLTTRNLPGDPIAWHAREKAAKLAALHAHDLHPPAGLPELLTAARHAGWRLAVASGSPRPTIAFVLEKLGLRDFFPLYLSGEEVPRGKPAPDLFLAVAGELDVPPGHCVVVEDALNGLLAARAAGMRCVGFQNPGSGGQDLSTADLVMTSFADPALWGWLGVE